MNRRTRWPVALAAVAVLAAGCTAEGEIGEEGIQGEVEPEEGEGGEGGDG